MAYKYLLAKSTEDSKNPRREETLLGHTERVIQSMQVLDELLSPSILSLLGAEIEADTWHTALFCAAWLHDLGKANDHFQKMMRDSEFRQGIRHETLGFVVIAELLEPWLRPLWAQYPAWLQAAVLFAVSGHHLKFPDEKERTECGLTEVTFLGKHSQIAQFLAIGEERLGLPKPTPPGEQKYSLLAFGGIGEKLLALQRRFVLDFSSSQKLFIGILKTMLLSADLAGSALPNNVDNIQEWSRPRLLATLQRTDLIKVAQERLRGKPLHAFQQKICAEPGNTVLVEAGCGSGKTVAAYLWAAEKAQGKRLFICYPTTGTASEGFSDYLQDPDFPAILIHSRADIDYRLLPNMPERSSEEDELHSLKLEAIETWPIPLAVCTADTVLGILQNVRRSLYAWPSLSRAVFVFDEIHSYDIRLFQNLLRFLEVFAGVPVLLMTATLPPERKEALTKVCSKRGGIALVSGPQLREKAKRYRLRRAGEEEAWHMAEETLRSGGKVLWICNTVRRAMERTQMAIQKLELHKSCEEIAKCGNPQKKTDPEKESPVQPYHSRYRYKDRLVRHSTVVDGFKPENKQAMLAITTQVAEMSLDLSADLLITEYAPIPFMIQRLGRLNRYEEQPATCKLALFLVPKNRNQDKDPLPYESGKDCEVYWQKIETWLNTTADNQPRSQAELLHAFLAVEKQFAEQEQQKLAAPLSCQWLDEPWKTEKQKNSLREAGCNIDVVREEDFAVQEYRLAELAIPMPFPPHEAWKNWQRQGRFLIAPKGMIKYDSFWGAEYAEEPDHYRTI